MSRSPAALIMFALTSMFVLPAKADAFDFQSPSGNIHCMADDDPSEGGVRCDILQMSRISFPDKPDDCNLDWGRAFYVGAAEPSTPACAGDIIVNPDSRVLEYGERLLVGDYIVCYSEKTGMECQNSRGSGFSLSRQKQTVY